MPGGHDLLGWWAHLEQEEDAEGTFLRVARQQLSAKTFWEGSGSEAAHLPPSHTHPPTHPLYPAYPLVLVLVKGASLQIRHFYYFPSQQAGQRRRAPGALSIQSSRSPISLHPPSSQGPARSEAPSSSWPGSKAPASQGKEPTESPETPGFHSPAESVGSWAQGYVKSRTVASAPAEKSHGCVGWKRTSRTPRSWAGAWPLSTFTGTSSGF